MEGVEAGVHLKSLQHWDGDNHPEVPKIEDEEWLFGVSGG